MRSRKYVNNAIYSIEILKKKYKYSARYIVLATSQDEYEQTIKHYDKIIENLTKELISLPIGYRYTGTFYIKNSNHIPAEFTKHNGAVFMREDLISWQIENGLDHSDPSYYYRNIYKEEREDSILDREDAEPVYPKLEIIQ